MTSGHLLVLGASVLWILLCMRFWWAIDREHTWQRRFIAIGAGLGGGLIYLIGSMMLEMLKETPEVEGRFRLFNRASQTYLGGNGLTPDKSRAALRNTVSVACTWARRGAASPWPKSVIEKRPTSVSTTR